MVIISPVPRFKLLALQSTYVRMVSWIGSTFWQKLIRSHFLKKWVFPFFLSYLLSLIHLRKKIFVFNFFWVIKSNLSLYSVYYAEACNEFAGPISASLRRGNTAPFEEMLQRWRAVGNSVSDWPALDLNLVPPAPQTNALRLDQLAGILGW